MGARRRKVEASEGTERHSAPAVLVVDDDEGSATLLTRVLTRTGYRARATGDPHEVLARMREQLPRCVVLDLRDGGMGSNLKVLDAIRSHDDERIASTRVVLCATNPRNRSFSFESGADAFLVHPFHVDELVGSVAEVLTVAQADRARHRRRGVDRGSPAHRPR